MRMIFASLLVVAACQKTVPGGGDDATNPDAPATTNAAFTITSSDLTLQPGDEITKCFYFHTPNATALPINKWTSHMTPGSHHMIMFYGTASQPADGTVDDNCGIGGGLNVPVWIYAAQTPDTEALLPPDDGAGKPLAQNVPPNQPAYFQMHYINTTDGPLTVHVSLSAYALAAGTAYTQTDAYITYNNEISIPPHAVNQVVTATCDAPAGVKFWSMSTHSHKQTVATDVMDGPTMMFQSTDWEHPGVQDWSATPFYTVASNKVTWSCTYTNAGTNANNTIVSGPSALTNEMCMATGYFFPSTGARFCVCDVQLGGCRLF